MRICEAQGINRGIASFTFTADMANYLNQAYIMQYPLELLAISERNPNAYPIARKLALHHSIDNNPKKGTGVSYYIIYKIALGLTKRYFFILVYYKNIQKNRGYYLKDFSSFLSKRG